MGEATRSAGFSARKGRVLAGLFAYAVGISAGPALAQDVEQQTADTDIVLPADEQAEVEGASIPPVPADVQLPIIEPIIDDEEFDELVPEFDPGDDDELSRPLESIEEFESRLAEEQGGEEGIGLAGTPLSDEDPVEAIPDAPIRDSALLEPLPPIETFEFEDREFAATPETELEEVRYEVEVSGLETIDEETADDLLDLFRSLSALWSNGREATNSAQITARLEEDAQLLTTILESEGWYNSSIRTRIVRAGDEGDEQLTALLEVDPGQRFSFGTIVVEAEPTEPPGLIEENLPLEVGQPIVAARVLAAEANVALVLPQSGYPFAEVGQRRILIDRDTGEGDYTLPVNVGQRARYGGFTTSGDNVFDVEHIEQLARFERGELYDSRDVDDLRKALVATGLFNIASATPEPTGQSAGDGTEYVNIHVEQAAGPPRTIAAQAGYGTGEGFRVEGSWTHRNLFPPEGALIVSGTAGTREQGLAATFRRSNAGRRDRTFQIVAEALHTSYAALDGYTARLSTLVSYDSTPIWQKRLTYAYGAQIAVTAEEDYVAAAGMRQRRTFYVAGLTGRVGWDTSDDLLDPTEGFRLTATVEPEGSLEDGFAPYVRAQLDGSAYLSVGGSTVLAGRIRLGTLQGAERLDVAPSRRFYAGGGGSVRGFGYQEVGPEDPNGDPTGGLSVNEAAIEVRHRFGDYGVVAFVDAGQAYESNLPKFSDLRFGAGIGGRFYTNFGPLRVDVATPLDRREGEGWISVYVSIGQAF